MNEHEAQALQQLIENETTTDNLEMHQLGNAEWCVKIFGRIFVWGIKDWYNNVKPRLPVKIIKAIECSI